ncbi:MAG: SlyX family protein [Methylovulum sp.]|nr:SlyX family protein [Methylovulum sp.]
MDDKRIIELEIKAAYQEDLLQALNNTVAQQQRTIDRLEATCQMLHERIISLPTAATAEHTDNLQHEIPPHY